MTESEQRAMIRETVAETLLQLGIDITDPEQILEFQRDRQHLHKWRKTVETIEGRTGAAAIWAVLTAIMAAAAIGLQRIITGN